MKPWLAIAVLLAAFPAAAQPIIVPLQQQRPHEPAPPPPSPVPIAPPQSGPVVVTPPAPQVQPQTQLVAPPVQR